MSGGYQLLEELLPPQIDRLCAHPKYFTFAVVILSWLAEQLTAELKEQLIDAQITVIKAEYLGAYPCLAIHYDHPAEAQDLAPLVKAAIKRLFENRSALEFMDFIGAGGRDWNMFTAALMSPE